MYCQANLFCFVQALCSSRGLAGGLHRRQEQRDQDANDRDHDQQFDKREAGDVIAMLSHDNQVS
jgi:hypothetical protein